MLTIIGFIALVLWLCKVASPAVGGMVLIGGIVLFLVIGHMLDMDEWKARRNCVEYWKSGGPYRKR